MPQLFTNNAWGTLASELAVGGTSLALTTGQGARFPAPTGGDFFLATLIGVTGTTETAWEVVRCTARSTDTLTITRAQESTSAATWPAGTRIELRLTAGATESKANLGAAAYKAVGTAAADVAAGNRGVTNGDSHDHNGGDGAQIAYANLSGLPTLGTAAAMAGPSGAIVGTTDTQSMTNKTLTGTQETVYAITDGASVDINPAYGGIQTWTLGGNRTPTAASFGAGQSVLLMINDGAAYTVTWTAVGVVWVGGTAPTLPTSGYGVVELWRVGATVYGASVGDVA